MDATLHFNLNLIKALEYAIDYMVIPELCHFLVKGPPRFFCRYLKSYVSDYKKNIEWLARDTFA